MNDAGSVLLSVRAEARQLVAPDYAVVDGLIEHTAGSKEEALRSASASVDRVTTDLAAAGGVAFDEGAQRRRSRLIAVQPRPYLQALEDAIVWFRQAGYLDRK